MLATDGFAFSVRPRRLAPPPWRADKITGLLRQHRAGVADREESRMTKGRHHAERDRGAKEHSQ